MERRRAVTLRSVRQVALPAALLLLATPDIIRAAVPAEGSKLRGLEIVSQRESPAATSARPGGAEAELERARNAHNAKVLEQMSKPPVGFAHYDAAAASLPTVAPNGEKVAETGTVPASRTNWIWGVFLLGLGLAAIGYAFRPHAAPSAKSPRPG